MEGEININVYNIDASKFNSVGEFVDHYLMVIIKAHGLDTPDIDFSHIGIKNYVDSQVGIIVKRQVKIDIETVIEIINNYFNKHDDNFKVTDGFKDQIIQSIQKMIPKD